jgi:hypothetical protein
VSQPPAAGAWPSGPSPPPPALPAPAPREAKWIPPLAALLVLLFVVFGGFLFAGEPGAAGQELTEAEPGRRVEVAPGVTLFPPEGWHVQEPLEDPPGVRLIAGTGNLLVLVRPGGGDPQALLDEYVAQILEPDSSQLSLSEVEPVPLPSGLPALRFAYIGVFQGVQAPLEGEVTVVVGSGNAVAFDGWAAEGLFTGARQDVRLMVETAEVS